MYAHYRSTQKACPSQQPAPASRSLLCPERHFQTKIKTLKLFFSLQPSLRHTSKYKRALIYFSIFSWAMSCTYSAKSSHAHTRRRTCFFLPYELRSIPLSPYGFHTTVSVQPSVLDTTRILLFPASSMEMSPDTPLNTWSVSSEMLIYNTTKYIAFNLGYCSAKPKRMIGV